MLQNASQCHGRLVIARDRDANSGAVRITNTANRGASRHKMGEGHEHKWRREPQFCGPRWADSQEAQVTRPGIKAFYRLARTWMSDHLHLDTEARCQRASDLHIHYAPPVPAHLTGCSILRVLREKQRNPNLASLHEIRDARVTDLLCRCLPTRQ